MDMDKNKLGIAMHVEQLLGELNNGFMISLLIYSKEDNDSHALLKYDCTLRAMGLILEDTFKLIDMLEIGINCKDYASVTNYGFNINKPFFDIHEELSMMDENTENRVEELNITDKEFLEECVQNVRACLSYLTTNLGTMPKLNM